jgi:hypothetical protein
MRPLTLYEVLGVPPSAPPAAVRQAYVALARQHHPDREGGDASTMRAVNEAWATLRDPVRRAAYDLTLHAPTATASSPPEEPPPWRTDDEDLLADLADDTPLGGQVVLPPWISIVPVAVFALSILAVVTGMLFASSPALAVAVALFLLSCALFLAAPFVALLSSRRRSGDRPPEQSR